MIDSKTLVCTVVSVSSYGIQVHCVYGVVYIFRTILKKITFLKKNKHTKTYWGLFQVF